MFNEERGAAEGFIALCLEPAERLDLPIGKLPVFSHTPGGKLPGNGESPVAAFLSVQRKYVSSLCDVTSSNDVSNSVHTDQVAL